MQCTLGSLNLTFDLQSSKRDEWEREALAQRMHKSVKIMRGLPKGRPTSIYKHPKQIEPLYPYTGHFSGRPDAPVETHRTRSTMSDHPVPSTCSPEFKRDRSILQQSLRANGQTQRPDASLNRPDAPIAQHRAPAKHRPDTLQTTTERDSASVWLESSKLSQRPDAFDRV
jgi:hypothetical protein